RMEHHANIVPWQLVAKERGAVLRVAPADENGEVPLEGFAALLGPRTKIAAFAHANNSLGTVLPVAEMTALAKSRGVATLIDGAQSVAHLPTNVNQLGVDYYVFSGHKIYGPTGIGVLYGRKEALASLPPWQGGGNMIRDVTFDESTFQDPPGRFEAGTPSIVDAVGLGSALDYVTRLGLPAIAAYEHGLTHYAIEGLRRIAGVRIVGNPRERAPLVSFVMDRRSTEEIGKALDKEGIAVRSGHHCAQPSLRRYGLEATVRPSFSFYNTQGEIDRLLEVVRRLARS
ncbi:MAG TPA: cysteine desulfurase, partial [Planctomycetia bacterium]|nr:cysteine desulfurase [Planctomycetia bacterium]